MMGDEPELKLLVEKGDGANGDGEKGDDPVVDAGGANGDGSWSTCTVGMFGDSVACDAAGDAEADAEADEEVSRGWKGGRPSWNARSSSCASQ
jgi:hypothetical protein